MLEIIVFCIAFESAYADGRDCPHYAELPPCAFEDSSDCYWNAATRGNGYGESFVDIGGLLFSWNGKVES